MQTDELPAVPRGFIVSALPAVRIILLPCQSNHKNWHSLPASLYTFVVCVAEIQRQALTINITMLIMSPWVYWMWSTFWIKLAPSTIDQVTK